MWVFTKYGFFSAVYARQGDGQHGQPVDRGRIMVRARVRAHLEALKRRFPVLLGQSDIREAGRRSGWWSHAAGHPRGFPVGPAGSRPRRRSET